MLKIILSLFIFGFSALIHAEDIPKAIEIDGKIQFNVVDASGKPILINYLKSSNELTNASFCSIRLSAYDDFYNNYSTQINLANYQNETVAFIEVESQYIDENGRYSNNEIEKFNISSGPFHVNNSNWDVDIIKGKYVLFSNKLSEGHNAFHQISLGQPIKVVIVGGTKPEKVTFNIKPVNSKTASFIRKCMEVIG